MDTEVLIVGAGPVGLMAGIELRRRGIDVVIVDRRAEIGRMAKACGIQPRTLEIWDSVGAVRSALDLSSTPLGLMIFVNGQNVGHLERKLPDGVPYRYVHIPQYATEQMLAEHLASLGATVRRGAEIVEFAQSGGEVTAVLHECGSQRTISAQYMLGADGAHSMVRKSLGLTFKGGAFAPVYLRAEVTVRWSHPAGYGIRSLRQSGGVNGGVLVCTPLRGNSHYQMQMTVPNESSTTTTELVPDGYRKAPNLDLSLVQTVLDQLAPVPATATDIAGVTTFRMNYRLVDRYRVGRVFLAGDAAHIYPPAGAQGMNTGIQDAYNLGWKLALALRGRAAPGLLDSYHIERHPIGEEALHRTVRWVSQGFGACEDSLATQTMRDAQLLVGYPDSPIVSDDGDLPGPGAGMRAPDATGLVQRSPAYPLRWHEFLRHPGHTLLLWATTSATCSLALTIVDEVARRTHDLIRGYVAVPTRAGLEGSGRVIADGSGKLASAYGFAASANTLAGYLIRPDGYIGYRSPALDTTRLLDHLACTTLIVD